MADRPVDRDFLLGLLVGLTADDGPDLPFLADDLVYQLRDLLPEMFREGDGDWRRWIQRLAYTRDRRDRRRAEVTADAIAGALTRSREPLDDLSKAIESTNARVGQLDQAIQLARAQTSQLSLESHQFAWALGSGVDPRSVRMTRFLPVSIYVPDPLPSGDVLERLASSVGKLMEAFDFEVADDLPAKNGSWLKQSYLRTKAFLTRREVTDRLQTVEEALTARHHDLPKSEANLNVAKAASEHRRADAEENRAAAEQTKASAELMKARAEQLKAEAELMKAQAAKTTATAAMMAAIASVDSAAIVVDGLVMVKASTPDGKSQVMIRQLSADGERILAESPSYLHNPNELLTLAQRFGAIEAPPVGGPPSPLQWAFHSGPQIGTSTGQDRPASQTTATQGAPTAAGALTPPAKTRE